jgi:hypothetical protein
VLLKHAFHAHSNFTLVAVVTGSRLRRVGSGIGAEEVFAAPEGITAIAPRPGSQAAGSCELAGLVFGLESGMLTRRAGPYRPS